MESILFRGKLFAFTLYLISQAKFYSWEILSCVRQLFRSWLIPVILFFPKSRTSTICVFYRIKKTHNQPTNQWIKITRQYRKAVWTTHGPRTTSFCVPTFLLFWVQDKTVQTFNTCVKMLSRKQRTIKAEVEMGPLWLEAVSESNDIFAFMG